MMNDELLETVKRLYRQSEIREESYERKVASEQARQRALEEEVFAADGCECRLHGIVCSHKKEN